MTMIAFLLRPWIELVKSFGAKLRILADDIMVWADGEDQENVFKDAYNATSQFIEDLGGKAAPE